MIQQGEVARQAHCIMGLGDKMERLGHDIAGDAYDTVQEKVLGRLSSDLDSLVEQVQKDLLKCVSNEYLNSVIVADALAIISIIGIVMSVIVCGYDAVAALLIVSTIFVYRIVKDLALHVKEKSNRN